ncbi:MAG: cardiolipin synthase, partial [Actinomycetota bacterium]
MTDDIRISGVGAWIALIITLLILVLIVTIAVVSLIVVPRNRRPQSALAWLLLIYTLPLIGFTLFLMLGSRRLP